MLANTDSLLHSFLHISAIRIQICQSGQENLTKKQAVSQETLIKTLIQQKKFSIELGFPVNKKALLITAFISTLLTSSVAGTLFVGLGKANLYWYESVYEGEMSPPHGTPPPTVLILSPNNDTVYSSRSFSLIFNISIAQSYAGFPDVARIYYRPSWQSSDVDVPNTNSYKMGIEPHPSGDVTRKPPFL